MHKLTKGYREIVNNVSRIAPELGQRTANRNYDTNATEGNQSCARIFTRIDVYGRYIVAIRRAFDITYIWKASCVSLTRDRSSFLFLLFEYRREISAYHRQRSSYVVTNTATKLFAFTSYRINTRSIQTCFFGREPRSTLRMIPLSLSSSALECSGILRSHRVHVYQAITARSRDRFSPLRCFPAFPTIYSHCRNTTDTRYYVRDAVFWRTPKYIQWNRYKFLFVFRLFSHSNFFFFFLYTNINRESKLFF